MWVGGDRKAWLRGQCTSGGAHGRGEPRTSLAPGLHKSAHAPLMPAGEGPGARRSETERGGGVEEESRFQRGSRSSGVDLPCFADGQPVPPLLYVDDLLLTSTTLAGLQRRLDRLEERKKVIRPWASVEDAGG